MRPVGCHLFSFTEMVRPGLPSLAVECYAGDILAKYSDALIVSAFGNDFFPTPRSIFGAIHERYGVGFGIGLPDGADSVHAKFHRFPVEPCKSFRSLWVLEITEFEEGQQDALTRLLSSMTLLRQSIGALIQTGVRSISLPLLGTGSQGLDVRDVTFETLKLMKEWASTAPSLEVVRLFAYDFEKIAILNRPIGDFLQVRPQFSASALLSAATEELKQKLASVFDSNARQILEELLQLAASPNARADSIASKGRVFAEQTCGQIFKQFFPGQSCPDSLNPRLALIQQEINKRKQGWVVSYLRLLQACGNSALHDFPVPLNLTDAAAVVVSAIRVAEYAQGEIEPASSSEVQ